MVASMKLRALWDTAPCSLIEVDRRFRYAYCLQPLGVSSQYVPLKRRSTSMRLHGAISQKAVINLRILNLYAHRVNDL
jgi:hypothetical protein